MISSLIAFGLWAAAGTEPTCALSFDRVAEVSWRGRAGGGYDPLDPVERWQNLSLTVRHEGAACSYWLAIEDLRATGERQALAGMSALSYRLSEADGRLPREAGVVGAQVAAGEFAAGVGSTTLNLRVTLKAGQSIPPGLYRDELVLLLFAGTVDQNEARGVTLLPLQFAVRASLEMALAAELTGGGSLELGDLSAGAAATFELSLRGNARYHLTLSSENGGFLRARTGRFESSIPYQLRLGGRLIDGDTEIAGEAPGPLGRLLVFEVLVPPAPDALAGSYRDSLVFSVVAD